MEVARAGTRTLVGGKSRRRRWFIEILACWKHTHS